MSDKIAQHQSYSAQVGGNYHVIIRHQSHVTYLQFWNVTLLTNQQYFKFGRHPWSSGYGRRLVFRRSWVWIAAPYTRWTFTTFICCKNCLFERTKINEKEAAVAHLKKQYLKLNQWCSCTYLHRNAIELGIKKLNYIFKKKLPSYFWLQLGIGKAHSPFEYRLEYFITRIKNRRGLPISKRRALFNGNISH